MSEHVALHFHSSCSYIPPRMCTYVTICDSLSTSIENITFKISHCTMKSQVEHIQTITEATTNIIHTGYTLHIF